MLASAPPRMKVLLFANDLMPFGSLPTSGGGLRCYQLMKGLEAHGVEVLASMPGFTFLAEKYSGQIPAAQRELLWRWETQDAILRDVKPDVVLFASNWDHFNLTSVKDVPVVIDLHGSRLIETTTWGNPVSTDRKVEVLSQADCLITAGRWQRSYFCGWLVQAGRVPEDEHFIRYVPISLGPDLPEHVHPDPSAPETPRFVSGGGWFPWQNQAKLLFAASREVAARGRGSVDIFGTPHETPHSSPEDREIRDVYRRIQRLGAETPRIRVRGYLGRPELIEVYRRASVALEGMRYNLERELAFTTRTIEYLWCGLPVLYNDYAEISGHLREYDAGWTVDPDSDAAIEAVLEEIFSDPDGVRRKSGNAQRLVRDRFTWDKTILPLLDFVRRPTKAPAARPVLGIVSPLPSYLVPRGVETVVPLLLPRTVLRQAFIVPADGVRAVELPVTIDGARAHFISRLKITVRDAGSRVLARRAYQGEELAGLRSVVAKFPVYRRVKGGDRLVFALQIEGGEAGGNEPVGGVTGHRGAGFPFLSSTTEGTAEAEAEPSLALHFSVTGGRAERAVFLAGRAWLMFRTGQWRLLSRVIARRIPVLKVHARRLLGRPA